MDINSINFANLQGFSMSIDQIRNLSDGQLKTTYQKVKSELKGMLNGKAVSGIAILSKNTTQDMEKLKRWKAVKKMRNEIWKRKFKRLFRK